MDIDVVDGRAYVRAGRAVYRTLVGAGAARRLQNRWVELPPSSAELRELRALTGLERVLGAALTAHDGVYEAGHAEVGGRDAIRLRGESGATLYVAAGGAHLPLAIEPAHARGARIEFRDWNAPLRLRPPKGAVSLRELAQGAAR